MALPQEGTRSSPKMRINSSSGPDEESRELSKVSRCLPAPSEPGEKWALGVSCARSVNRLCWFSN